MTQTPKLDRILRMAAIESEGDGSPFTSTEHVAVAILLDDGTAFSNLLKEKGITVDKIRELTRSNTYANVA